VCSLGKATAVRCNAGFLLQRPQVPYFGCALSIVLFVAVLYDLAGSWVWLTWYYWTRFFFSGKKYRGGRIYDNAYSTGFEVLTAIFVKSLDFRDITPCSPLTVIRRSSSHHEERFLLIVSSWYAAWLILRPWGRRRYILPKHRFSFNGLHGCISQKIGLFMDILNYTFYVVLYVNYSPFAETRQLT
jgi:hypothetical protein